LKAASTAPPDTIIKKNTLPGSCWPMSGNSGQITLRLAYPLIVSSVTLEHVSSLLVPKGERNSAPKKVRIIGYPSCEKGDDCAAMGFDARDGIELAQLEFDVDGPSIQTFETTAAVGALPPKKSVDSGSIGDDSGSCSATAASCSAPQPAEISGITVQVLANWGNPEYTCLYRFRVHGEAA
jgi:SUN domain-containing protein 1/2